MIRIRMHIHMYVYISIHTYVYDKGDYICIVYVVFAQVTYKLKLPVDELCKEVKVII